MGVSLQSCTVAKFGANLIIATTAGNKVGFTANATGIVAAFRQDQFVYNTATGAMTFDSDGNAGVDEGTLVATLAGARTLTVNSIAIG